MQKWPGIALLTMVTAGAAQDVPEDTPKVTIRNEKVKAVLWLPDAGKGYYRGCRFDWSGLIARAEFDGRTVFGPFRPRHDPLVFDNVCGPATEFGLEDAPPGFNEAKVGEPFIKIGVGLLKKVPHPKYGFWHTYEFAAPPAWKVEPGPDRVEFRQEISHNGWGYAWTKRVSLPAGDPAIAIECRLKNTGTKDIDTRFYCHNFTLLDGEPVGPAYKIEFPFEVGLRKGAKGKARTNGREILLPEIAKNELVWAVLEGWKSRVEDNGVFIQNRKTGTAVRIQGDQPPVEWRFFARPTAACPEPFIRIQLAPGEEKSWRMDYRLLALPKEESR